MGIHLGVRSRERSTKFNPEAAITFQRSLRSCSPPLIALPSQSPVRTADIAQPTKQHSFLTLSNPHLFHQSRGEFPVRGLPRLPLRGSAPSGASTSDTLSASTVCLHIPPAPVPRPPDPSVPQDSCPPHHRHVPKETDASAPPGAATTAAAGGPGAGRT